MYKQLHRLAILQWRRPAPGYSGRSFWLHDDGGVRFGGPVKGGVGGPDRTTPTGSDDSDRDAKVEMGDGRGRVGPNGGANSGSGG